MYKINKNFLLFGDLHFILDPDKNKLNNDKKTRLALILLAMDYKQNAIDILEENKNFDREELHQLIKEFKKIKLRKKLLKIYNKLPYIYFNLNRNILEKKVY